MFEWIYQNFKDLETVSASLSLCFGLIDDVKENDATRDTNKLSARQKSCDYHYHQYTMPNRTNLFHKVKIVENEIVLRATNSIYSPHFAVWPPKRSVLERELGHLAAGSDNNVHLVFE